jgi:hypothetical protein
MFRPRIDELEFSGGETITVKDAEVIVFVGSNNSGKSVSLTELYQSYGNPNKRDFRVIKKTTGITLSTSEDFLAWCKKYHTVFVTGGEYFSVPTRDNHGRPIYGSVDDAVVQSQLSQSSPHNLIGNNLMIFLQADNRLSFSQGQSPINIWEDTKSLLSHYFRDNSMRVSINTEFRSAFKEDMVIDGPFRPNLTFRVGNLPESVVPESIYTPQLQQKIAQLRELSGEGHGMRAFTSCLFPIKIGLHKIVLIDEPELFLHPPQARRLGKIIAESAKEIGQQIIVATHSSEIIQGISSGTQNSIVIRLSRDGNINHAYAVGGDNLKELWKKPILQSSGALQGLFHEGVIVCESDADVLFYQSLMRRLEPQFGRPTDFYFIHSRGLGEVPTLAESYRKLNIPTAVVADFDVLRDKSKVKQIVEKLGAEFAVVENLYDRVIKVLSEQPKDYKAQLELTLREVTAEIDTIKINGKVSGENIRKIREMLEERRGWAGPKKYGIAHLSNKKQQYADCERLLDELKMMGLFVVPVGELECWDRALGDKPEWILAALESIQQDVSSFANTVDFLTELANFLWKPK